MSDKSAVLRTFNKHFFEFLEDIRCVLPDDKEITYAITSFDTIKRANPTVIAKTWYKFIFLRYKDVIDAGNLTYFIDKDYGEDLSSVKKSDEIVQIINNIRKPIRDMDEVNKQHSLKYIQNLTKLAEMYNNMS